MDVLMPVPMMPLIMDGIAATQTLHRMWDMSADEIAAVTPHIRALAVGGGHQPVDAAFMSSFPALEIVASFGVGYDHVDADWAAAHDVIVTHTPDVLNEEVADTAMGLLLATVRELPRAERFCGRASGKMAIFPLPRPCVAARWALSGWGASARPLPNEPRLSG